MSGSTVNSVPATRAVNWESPFLPRLRQLGVPMRLAAMAVVNTSVFTRGVGENAPEALAITQSRDLQGQRNLPLLCFFVNDRERPAGYRIPDPNQSVLASRK